MTKRRKKVLFLCTGNAARSQMAEGLMNTLSSGKWEAQSGGTFPATVHPLTIRVMEEIGIDISHHTSKSLNQFLKKKFDYIITLCDHAAMICPEFNGKREQLHWSIDDPAAETGTLEEKLAAFRRAREEIKTKIEAFLTWESSGPPDPFVSFEF